MSAPFEHVVVIGASAGGVQALLEIARGLPAAFSAPVCAVLHVGSNPSLLPELMRHYGPNHAMHAEDGQRLAPGTLHIAPPDRHLLLEGDVLRLSAGPKENHSRPAIDPLFRSAALAFGTRAIGVVLSGQMDDGSAGLQAVKECGGTAIVQDPATAAEPEMPLSAIASVDVDHCVPLPQIAPLLARLVGTPAAAPTAPPEQLVREVAINRGNTSMESLSAIGTPSPLTCPDCGGGLWEMKDAPPLRYRCHTGHAFSSLSLKQAQRETVEQALWSGVRALREREMLLRRLARIAEATGDAAQAQAGHAHADRLKEQSLALERLAEAAPPDVETGTA